MTWQPLNLAAPEYAVDPEPPHVDYGGLLYRGKRHVVSAPTESLKTLVVMALALDAIRAGRRIGLLDFEMGPHALRRLLVDLGATLEQLAAVYYVEPGGPPGPADLDAIAEQQLELVVIDASMGAFHASHLDDNKRQDVESFAAQWITPLWQRGIATVVLDHVTKAAEGRGKYAIGSERKVGQVDVHLGLEVIGTPLARGGQGLVKVHVHKDRPGFLHRPHAAEIALTSDPDTHRITWEVRPAANEPGDTFRPTVLMQRVSAFLQEQTEPVSLTTVENNVQGKSRDWIRKAVQALIDDGYISESRGSRGARMLTSARAYTTTPDHAQTTPGAVTTTTPSAPHPSKGGAVAGAVNGGVTTPGEIDPDYVAYLESIAAEMADAGELA